MSSSYFEREATILPDKCRTKRAFRECVLLHRFVVGFTVRGEITKSAFLIGTMMTKEKLKLVDIQIESTGVRHHPCATLC